MEQDSQTPKLSDKIKMVVIELTIWWIIGAVWGMFAVTVLGFVVPYPTLILISAYWLWSSSPMGKESRLWVYTKVRREPKNQFAIKR